jgi:hypothetical protein
MTRYVIGPDVAIHLAGEEAVIPDGHHMLAPMLLRSQMLSLLYQAVHRGEMTKEDAERRLFYARGMRIRGVAGPGIQPRTAGGHDDRSQEADPEG